MSETKTYSVPGMHCAHCEAAVSEELSAVPGVANVEVDLDAKLVTVTGEALDDASLRAAIDEAGYEVAA
jgi:copper chaperone